jgi:hypothetical protein
MGVDPGVSLRTFAGRGESTGVVYGEPPLWRSAELTLDGLHRTWWRKHVTLSRLFLGPAAFRR